MIATLHAPRNVVVLTAGGLLLTALATPRLVGFVSSRPYGDAAPLIVLPILIAASVPIIRRVAAGHEEWQLLWVLWGGLALKLLGSLYRYYAAFELYGGGIDAVAYHDEGALIAAALRRLDIAPLLGPASGTAFMPRVVGVLYVLVGTSQPAGFVLFAWLSFLGQLAFVRAFVVSQPETPAVPMAVLMVALPTLVYWPSSIGKDAWMVFSLGIGALGASRLLAGDRMRSGWLLTVVGVAMAAQVRPHVAALLVISVAVAAVVRRRPATGHRINPAARFLLAGVLLLVALGMVTRAESFLEESRVLTDDGGLAAALDTTARRTSVGDSEFTPTVVRTPLDFPVAALTVLFRPHVFEAHNLQALIVAAEGTALLVLVGVRSPRLLAMMRRWREHPFAVMSGVYIGLFVVGFSSIGNFGILARQRSQVIPFLAALLVMSARAPAARTGSSIDTGEPLA